MINLTYLKYFCDAIKLGSVSASARANFVTQSAISQGIAKLERDLNTTLITHQQNRFKATHEGHIVFEQSKEIFNKITTIQENLSDDSIGRLEFACTHSFALGMLPEKLKQLQKIAPKLQINFRLGHTDKIKEWLKLGVIDFGICIDNEDFSGFDCSKLYEGKHQLYADKRLKNYKSLRYIISEERKETHLLKTAYYKKYKSELPVLMEISSWEVISSLTEEGLGIGFVPDYIAYRKHPQLKAIDLGLPDFSYNVLAIFPKHIKKPRACDLFISMFNTEH